MQRLTAGVSGCIFKSFPSYDAALRWISEGLPDGMVVKNETDIRAIWANTPLSETNLTNPFLTSIPANGWGKEFTYTEDNDAALSALRSTAGSPTIPQTLGASNRALSPPTATHPDPATDSPSRTKRQRQTSPNPSVVPKNPFAPGPPPHAGAHVLPPREAGPANYPLPARASLPFLLIQAAPFTDPSEIVQVIDGVAVIKQTGGYSASFGKPIACEPVARGPASATSAAPALLLAPCTSLAVASSLIGALSNVTLYDVPLNPRWISASEMQTAVRLTRRPPAEARAWAFRTNDPIIRQAKLMCHPSHHGDLLSLLKGPDTPTDILDTVISWANGTTPPPSALNGVPPTIPVTTLLPISPVTGPAPSPGPHAFTPIKPSPPTTGPPNPAPTPSPAASVITQPMLTDDDSTMTHPTFGASSLSDSTTASIPGTLQPPKAPHASTAAATTTVPAAEPTAASHVLNWSSKLLQTPACEAPAPAANDPTTTPLVDAEPAGHAGDEHSL